MEKLLWEEEIDKLFEKAKKTDSELLLNILTIVVFNRFNSKIGKIYKIINDMGIFTDILKELSNQDVRFPDVDEFKDALILALVYYYKRVKLMSWNEIQSILKYEKDIPIRFGKRVASIDKTIKKQLDELLKNPCNEDTTIFD